MIYLIAAGVVLAVIYLGATALGYDIKAMLKTGWEKFKALFNKDA